MRVLLLAPTTVDHVALRTALGAAVGATSIDTCHVTEAAVTWLENRPCDLVGIVGPGASVADAIERLRRVSRTITLLAIVDDGTAREAGLAWLAGADEVLPVASLPSTAVRDGLDDVRRQDRDALRRTQQAWYAGPSDPHRQQLAMRLGQRLRDVGLSAEGLAGLTTQDVEAPHAAALIVNALADPAPFVLGVRRVKRTYPGLAITVLADTPHHDAFRRAGADECVTGQPDVEHILHAVGRAQTVCRGAQELDTLRTRETRLRALLENLPEAVVLVSPEHAVLAVNLAALRLLGAQDARQVLGSALAPWLEAEDADANGVTGLVDAVTGGATREAFVRTRHLAEPRRIHVRAVPFQRESGGAPAALVVLRDLASLPLAPPSEPIATVATDDERHAWAATREADAGRIEALERSLAEAHAEVARIAILSAELDVVRADACRAAALDGELEVSRAEIERLQSLEHDVRTAAARIAELEGLVETSREAMAAAVTATQEVDAARDEVIALRAALDDARAQVIDTTQIDAADAAAGLARDEAAQLRTRVSALERIEAEEVPALQTLVEQLRARDAAQSAQLDDAWQRLADAQERVDGLEHQLATRTYEEAATAAATPAQGPSQLLACETSTPMPAIAGADQWLLEHVAQIGVLVTRRDGQIVEANDRGARLCGFASADDLRHAGRMPDALQALGAADLAEPARFELCMQSEAESTPVWVMGARLAAAGDEDTLTWWLADASDRHAATLAAHGRSESFGAVLEVATAECAALVGAAIEPPRGPRPIESLHDTIHVPDARAIGRAQVVLAQLTTLERRRATRQAAVDVAAQLSELEPTLKRLAGPELGWQLSVPTDAVHACITGADLERCLTAVVASVRDAMPLGGRLAVSMGAGPAACTDSDGIVRADVLCAIEAQGFGLTPIAIADAVREFTAAIGATLSVESLEPLTATVTLRLPRAFVVTHAA
ncbi:MAG TPA: PAS domain-containing protein [Luteitalea sp.]|nr:PAS domain-containing protein [Luteitalea sp.]